MAECTMNLGVHCEDHRFILGLDVLQAYDVAVDLKHHVL